LAAIGVVVVAAASAVFAIAIRPSGRSSDFARINGVSLQVADLKKNLADAGATRVKRPFEEVCAAVVRDMIDAELICQEARARGEKDVSCTQAVKEFMAREIHREDDASEDEIRAYYEQNVNDVDNRGVAAYRSVLKKEVAYAKAKAKYEERLARLRAAARIEVDWAVLRRELGVDLRNRSEKL
jgi:predicted solute-binding protein